ncbi:MAG: 50S ribosomal protein L9 [Coriobacteriia bacterium]|nr:50S ribosomal protein L9 [Coriobacteriia bacterium]
MKVILLQELKGKGSEGDVVEVARGFAVNYLFPRKLAVEATKGNVKQLEARRGNIEKREEARRTDARSIATRLEGKTVLIQARAGEGGRLYGSITSQMIEDAILGQLDVEIDRRKLDVHGHIKDLGDHAVSVRLHKDVAATVNVRVEAEGGEGVPGAEAATTEAPAPTEEQAAEAEEAEEAAGAEETAGAETRWAEEAGGTPAEETESE